MKFEPELLRFASGEAVTAENWEARRQEIIEILSREEYGFTPKAPESVSSELMEKPVSTCAGYAMLERRTLSFETPKGPFSFPFYRFVPTAPGKHPTVVIINFRPEPYDRYFPAEEIIDRGFELVAFDYQTVARDDNEFNEGIAVMYDRDPMTGWGKLGMWAFAASRIIDWLQTQPEVDMEHLGVCGHSRLGKTALWCAAQDPRVRYGYSNDSGCSGAAYERIKHEGSETVRVITKVFPGWFCGNFVKYAENPDARPFDQHFLLAAAAPRFLCVGSASLDAWADQYSEQLSCIGASPAWELFGLPGFSGPETPAANGDRYFEGTVGYHLRDGSHYFSRRDWNAYLDFILRHW